MTHTYELTVLLHPDLEIDVEAPVQKLEALVQAVDGRIAKRDNWGKKRLAYRIRRQDFAVYVYFELELEASRVRELENTILITEEVLRHLLVAQAEVSDRSVRQRAGRKAAKRPAATGAAGAVDPAKTAPDAPITAANEEE